MGVAPMRLSLLPFWLASLLPLGGCCSLARLFCGPDTSPWVSQRFDSPRHTAATLFEALRRDAPEAVFLCLAPAYRRRLGIGDSLVLSVFWPRFRETNPYLHAAGYTEVPEPKLLDPDHATVDVDVMGEPVAIDLQRFAVWELRYTVPGTPAGDQSGTLRSFADRAQVVVLEDRMDPTSRVMLAPFEFVHDAVTEVPLEAIDHVALTRRWWITDIRRR